MKEGLPATMDLLFEEPVYSASPRTDELFYKALQEELTFHYEHNEQYRRFCDRKDFDPRREIGGVEEIPPVAVSVFKELGPGLASVPREEIKLRLQSSATSGTPSTIVVDKTTSRRQAKAMVKVMQEFIGKERKPFLVMDIDPRSEFRSLLGARFAAITGYLNFASQAGFFLKARDGISYFDVDAMSEFVASLPKDRPVVVFGFTYILYQHVVKALRDSGVTIPLPQGSKIIHIGGWKKLESEKVDKEIFNAGVSAPFGLQPSDVIDIYGFTEQMGLNYPDCQCGCKHTSSYVKVLVRDVVTNEILPAGQEGKLEFVSPVPHSYPGNAVLTDDLGVIVAGECPYGRPGTRFKVTGRLKKAEVRGCGDILSEKLAFRSKAADSGAGRESLDILLFKGEASLGDSPEARLAAIVESLRGRQDWLLAQKVDDLAGLIGEAARKWMSDPAYLPLRDKGLFFLSNWCSADHLRKVAAFGLRGNIGYADGFLPFPDSDRHLLKAVPRGLACHWLAGNVQILGMFALVQCILAKNVNLLKVSARDGGVFSSLLGAFEELSYTSAEGRTLYGRDLLRTLAVVYFPRESAGLGELMSKSADIRIAWGGQEAVRTVAGYPSIIGSETVIFGPKLSFAVISREMLSDEQTARKLARRVSVDASVFDQTGCASPHNLFVEKGGGVSPAHFCEILGEAMRKTELQIPKPGMSPEQVSAIHSVRGVYDFCGVTFGSDSMSWTILADDSNDLHKPVYSRALFVHEVDDIEDSLKHVTEDIQTIGIEAPRERAAAYAAKAASLGAARFPQIGRMLNYEAPWDGIVLMDRLVRWITLSGPLV
ncbi:MAG: acyl-CoA reductase [Bacteroidales bacterium]|nr:acyl-CoA reductase [Bacteroidales bacterium]